jgi:hypothetical protein
MVGAQPFDTTCGSAHTPRAADAQAAAGRLREARPALKTLPVTSHTAFVDTKACGTDAHLAKPFCRSELREAVSTPIGGC